MGTDVRQPLLRRRASRPQLERDPLGGAPKYLVTLLCLIHGSTQNAQCWQWLSPLLSRAGFRCLPVDLHATGTDQPLTRFTTAIVDSLETVAGEPVVLVGHSIAGLLLRLVAGRRPIAGLVYLAAAIPKPGCSFRDRVREEPDMFNSRWVQAGPRWADPADHPALAAEFLFHDCPPELLRQALKTVKVLDVTAMIAEAHPREPLPSIPSSYVVCSRDRTLNPTWSRRAARAELGVQPVEISAGHCPHVCQPHALAGLLASEVRRLTSA